MPTCSRHQIYMRHIYYMSLLPKRALTGLRGSKRYVQGALQNTTASGASAGRGNNTQLLAAISWQRGGSRDQNRATALGNTLLCLPRAAGGKQSCVLLPKASCASCCGVHHVQINAWSVGGSLRSGSRTRLSEPHAAAVRVA
jgi:hypothetical protein